MKYSLRNILGNTYHTLIFLTLLFCLYLMFKYFYFNDNKPLDLGAISTWISAACSIATLFVALKALRDWSNKKDNEEAYDLAKKVMIEDYFEVIFTLQELNDKITRIRYEIEASLTVPGFTPHNKIRTRNELVEYLKDRELVKSMLRKKKYNLMSIQKLGYKLDNSSSEKDELVTNNIKQNLQQIEFFISEHDTIYNFINSPSFTVGTYTGLSNFSSICTSCNNTLNGVELKFALLMSYKKKFFEHFEIYS